MSATNVKQEAHRLVDNLPENATWDKPDLPYLHPANDRSRVR